MLFTHVSKMFTQLGLRHRPRRSQVAALLHAPAGHRRHRPPQAMPQAPPPHSHHGPGRAARNGCAVSAAAHVEVMLTHVAAALIAIRQGAHSDETFLPTAPIVPRLSRSVISFRCLLPALVTRLRSGRAIRIVARTRVLTCGTMELKASWRAGGEKDRDGRVNARPVVHAVPS